MNENVEKRIKEIEEQHEKDAKKRVCSWVEQQVPHLLALVKAQREALELSCYCGDGSYREIKPCAACVALAFNPDEVK